MTDGKLSTCLYCESKEFEFTPLLDAKNPNSYTHKGIEYYLSTLKQKTVLRICQGCGSVTMWAIQGDQHA